MHHQAGDADDDDNDGDNARQSLKSQWGRRHNTSISRKVSSEGSSKLEMESVEWCLLSEQCVGFCAFCKSKPT